MMLTVPASKVSVPPEVVMRTLSSADDNALLPETAIDSPKAEFENNPDATHELVDKSINVIVMLP